MSTLSKRFDYLFEERQEKPRDTGITMIEGDGPFATVGANYMVDLVNYAGNWFDLYKFQRGVFALQDKTLLKQKLALLESHDIISFPGGISLEAAILANKEAHFLEGISNLGFTGVEVSATASDISAERRGEVIEMASELGLYVNAEIGKKATETKRETIDIDSQIEEMDHFLDSGADMLIFEMEEIEEMVVTKDDLSEEAIDSLNAVIDEVGKENIMFELPFSPYFELMEVSGWFMNNFGNDVNLGNIRPPYLLPLEQQRRGLGQYTFQRNR